MRKVKARKMAKTSLLMGLILTLAISLFCMGGGIQALSLSEAPPENPPANENVVVELEVTPAEPEETPVDLEGTPVDSEETPVEPEVTPAVPEETPADPEANPDLGVSPENVPEPVGAPQANTVTLVGQWVAESSKTIDTTKTYDSLNEKIGEPQANDGLLRKLAKTFLGWSDQPAINNGELAPGARLYSPSDTIGTAFPNGIPSDAKLYGIYWSLNNPVTDPFPQDSLSLLALSGWDQQLGIPVNRNSVMINSFVAGEDILPFTKNHIDSVAGSERTILDYYQSADEPNQVHEVVLEAQHHMDPTIAMLVYKNPVGSNQLLPILSRDYAERYKNNTFNLQSGKDADYTYMDLVVQIDPEIKMPDKVIYLQFDSYTWQPLYFLDAEQNKLPVLNPSNEGNLGTAPTSFDTLISPNSKTTVFAVDLSQAQLKNNTSDYQELTLRTVLRKHGKDGGEGKDIAESGITPNPGMTIAETIQEDMRLVALTSSQITNYNANLSPDQVMQRVVTIPDAIAKQLAETGRTLAVTGYIEGLAVADAGEVSAFGQSLSLGSSVLINKCPANTLYLGYIPTPTPDPTEPLPTAEPSEPLPTAEPTEPLPTAEPTEPLPTEIPYVGILGELTKPTQITKVTSTLPTIPVQAPSQMEVRELPRTGDLTASTWLATSALLMTALGFVLLKNKR